MLLYALKIGVVRQRFADWKLQVPIATDVIPPVVYALSAFMNEVHAVVMVDCAPAEMSLPFVMLVVPIPGRYMRG